MLPVLGLGLDAQVRVDQELVAVEPDVVLAVGGRDQNPEVVFNVNQLATHLRDDVIEHPTGVVGTFTNEFDLQPMSYGIRASP